MRDSDCTTAEELIRQPYTLTPIRRKRSRKVKTMVLKDYHERLRSWTSKFTKIEADKRTLNVAFDKKIVSYAKTSGKGYFP